MQRLTIWQYPRLLCVKLVVCNKEVHRKPLVHTLVPTLLRASGTYSSFDTGTSYQFTSDSPFNYTAQWSLLSVVDNRPLT